jgi:hypothetical protein
MVITAHIDK